MKSVYLIRHGATEANERHLYCGSSDIPLSDLGRRQVEKYAAEGVYPPADGLKLYTSGMQRTNETLRCIYGAARFEVLADMREIDFGDFEMQSYEQLKDRADYLEWISGDNEQKRCPNGESGAEMSLRACRAFRALGSDSLVVTHGGVIAAVMRELFPDEGRNRYEWQPRPGRGYKITVKNDRVYSYTPI